MNKKGVPIFSR